MDTSFLVFLGLCVMGLVIRTIYELLKKAGRLNPKNKAVFTVVFVAMCMMLTSWFILCPSDPFHILLPDIARWIGLGMLIVGLGLAVGAFLQLRGLENINHLVTNGLFSKIRHPMYTGFILWIMGWVIYYGAVVSLVVGLVCIANILYWQRLEEEKLVSDFGEDYRRYRLGTWF